MKEQDEILHINRYIQLDERSAAFGLSAWLSLAGVVVISGAALAFPEIAKIAIEKLPNLEITKKLTEDMVEKVTNIIWGGNIGLGVAAAFNGAAKRLTESRMRMIENSVARAQRPRGYNRLSADRKTEFTENAINNFIDRVDNVKEERGIDTNGGKKR